MPQLSTRRQTVACNSAGDHAERRRLDISQIDFKLSCIQAAIDRVADGIASSNVNFSAVLRLQVLNIACVRNDIVRAAEKGSAKNQRTTRHRPARARDKSTAS